MSLGGSQEESKSSITYKDNTSPDSPMAFFDETNRKVLIISNEHQKENDKGGQMNGSGQKVQHTIAWDEDTDPRDIEQAIEEVLQKVKGVESAWKASSQATVVQVSKKAKVVTSLRIANKNISQAPSIAPVRVSLSNSGHKKPKATVISNTLTSAKRKFR